jgi:negative regulator of flagellin synthesis FlgM
MKISSSPGVNTPQAGGVNGRASAPRSNEASAPAGGGTTVRLSELSTQLVGAAAGPDFDHARVESIKQAIADGKLEVNADAVADKLIANALALAGHAAK